MIRSLDDGQAGVGVSQRGDVEAGAALEVPVPEEPDRLAGHNGRDGHGGARDNDEGEHGVTCYLEGRVGPEDAQIHAQD